MRSSIANTIQKIYLQEFLSGNIVFQFDTQKNSLLSTNNEYFEEFETNKPNSLFDYPTHIHSLTEPFFGTDSTVGSVYGGDLNDLVFYYVIQPANRIQAFNFYSQRRTSRLLLNASKVKKFVLTNC